MPGITYDKQIDHRAHWERFLLRFIPVQGPYSSETAIHNFNHICSPIITTEARGVLADTLRKEGRRKPTGSSALYASFALEESTLHTATKPLTLINFPLYVVFEQ
jgi:hypothetical protein